MVPIHRIHVLCGRFASDHPSYGEFAYVAAERVC